LTARIDRSEVSLRPNLAVLVGGGGAVFTVSMLSLPWPAAVASSVLGLLMIAAADVDAKTLLLPDVIIYGAIGSGIIAAVALGRFDAWHAIAAAIARGSATALVLALLRWSYARVRTREGLGFGDVKLAVAVGVWLPAETIPLCFGLAAGAALIAVMLARFRGETIDASTRVPFGAFLCPALWLVFFAGVLLS
jgi:leader peptidase (prepilin peptidase) / N-methyltransferase